MRVGIGFDVHRLTENRKLILGGVEVPCPKGLLGHSDADVLVHAVIDALLGAASLGDIGSRFPDTDERYKGINSLDLLKDTIDSVRQSGYTLVNIDSVIMAEKPKLAPYIQSMRVNLAKCFDCDVEQISVKATTTEKLGFVGREEGIAAQAVVLVAEAE